jgi:hypothetical protein
MEYLLINKMLPMIKNIPIVKTVKNCNTCRYNIKSNGANYCNLFRYMTILIDNSKKIEYINVEICRSSEDLCGPHGLYHKEP